MARLARMPTLQAGVPGLLPDLTDALRGEEGLLLRRQLPGCRVQRGVL